VLDLPAAAVAYAAAAAAGVGAGVTNAVIGAGTLVTFPVLLALGLPPVTANVTSAVGVFPGSLTGAWVYRDRLRRLRRTALGATLAMCAGAVAGTLLLLLLPPGSFTRAVPWLIGGAGLLVLLQPMITRAAQRGGRAGSPGAAAAGCGVAGTYLGYFGAATGVITLTALLFGGTDDLQDANAVKNLATGAANGLAAVMFLALADVRLGLAVAIAVGAAAGGLLGGRVAQKLSPKAFRALIFLVAVGVALASAGMS
jgi:uncharacterized membrane protein YfcA